MNEIGYGILHFPSTNHPVRPVFSETAESFEISGVSIHGKFGLEWRLSTDGVYQWAPLKHACLKNCRALAEFLSRSWRNGTGGAVAMGIHYGIYCVGCCWVLMGLLFMAGVMNLLWVAAITALVLIEKIAPGGHRFAHIAGALFISAGAFIMVYSYFRPNNQSADKLLVKPRTSAPDAVDFKNQAVGWLRKGCSSLGG